MNTESITASESGVIPREALSHRKAVLALASIAVSLAVFFIPMQISPSAHKALAITIWMVLFWIFEPMDHALTGLVGSFLYWASGCVKFDAAFGGFATDTPWFLFGAIILGTMAYQTGLALRLAYAIISIMGDSYSRILLGIIVVDFLLTFIVPSGTARVVILASISLGIVEAFGVAPKSNISRGLFLIFTYSATIFDKMVLAGVTSILARGVIQEIGNVPVYYSHWALAFIPCDLITVAACWLTILWLYPPERKQLPTGQVYVKEQLAKLGRFGGAEKRAAVILGITIVLWLTDFIHHLSPTMVGFGAGLVACLPRIGVLNSEDLRKIDKMPVMLVAAVLSMAAVLIQTKAVDVLNVIFFSWMQPFITTVNSSVVLLYWTGFVYHFFLPEPAMISTSMPLLMQFAKTNNLSPLGLGMIWTFAAGGKIFIYQSPVLVVGYSYGHFEGKDLLKVGLVLTAVESLILMLLVPFYWPLLGIR